MGGALKRQHVLALSALAAMLLSAMPATAQEDAEVRTQLEAQYQ
jgi:hypothetical protein